MTLSHKFKNFFDQFDLDLDELGIRSYGISVTTLEEVFLQVGAETADSSIEGRTSNPLRAIQTTAQAVLSPRREKHYSIADEMMDKKSALSIFFD